MRAFGIFFIILLVAIIFIPAVSAEHLVVTNPATIAKLMQRGVRVNVTPFIAINPIENHIVGSDFTISARTNLAINTDINYIIYPTSMHMLKTQYNVPATPNGTLKVNRGNGFNNMISINVDTSLLRTGEYVVHFENPFAVAYFNILPAITEPTKNPTPISPPYVIFDPIDNVTVGDVITVRGITNVPVGSNLTIEIYNNFCGRPSGSECFIGKPVYAITGPEINHPNASAFSCKWDTSGNFSGVYVVEVFGKSNRINATHFFLQDRESSR